MAISTLQWRIVIDIDPRRKYSPIEELWRGQDLADPEIPKAVAAGWYALRRPKLQVHNGKDWYNVAFPPDPRMGVETFNQVVQALQPIVLSELLRFKR